MYQALYRKYRPQTFSDVVGQDHITKTLARQVQTRQFSHAYLFTGTRGTGKTTCAKIFAKAVNCLDPKNGEPCGECEICRGIADGSIFDIVEIDAASNNGVDDVRQIRDEILFLPARTQYKVYIIDEVHMLSPAAFNALLKTLEEPPAHIIFVLATTEPHKVPATILSRCQRHDFFRLSVEELSSRIRYILGCENKSLSDESISLVASLADGSVRDSLSILDKVIESGSTEELEKVLGVIGRDKIYQTVENIADGNTTEIFKLINELYSSSKDMGIFAQELIDVYRKMMIVLSSSSPCDSLLDCGAEELARIKGLASKHTASGILYCMKVLKETKITLAKSDDPRTDMEICALLLVKPSLNEDFSAISARIEKLENKISSFASELSKGVRPRPSTPAEPVPRQETEHETDEQKTVSDVPRVNTAEIKVPEPEVPSIDEKTVSETPAPSESDTPVISQGSVSGSWRELDSWDMIIGRINNKLCQIMLRTSSRAVYRNKELVILFESKEELERVDANRELISKALSEDRKGDWKFTMAVGEISEYVKKTEEYNNIESNAMFDFE